MKRIVTLIICVYIIFNNTYAQELSLKLQDLYTTIDENVDITKNAEVYIGVSVASSDNRISVSNAYIQSIIKAGGTPIVIPQLTDVNLLGGILDHLDGLILTGGVDIDPAYFEKQIFNETVEVDSIRDISDLMLIKLATDRNIPILGICRGEQALNVAFGGSLIQDIPSQVETDIQHSQEEESHIGTHKIKIVPESKLAEILGTTELAVNSFHHQSVKNVANHFKAVAHSQDGLVEAIEAYPHRKILAVQWHPEMHVAKDDTVMLKLFANLINEAKIFKKAKELHKRILSIDSHIDTPLCFKQNGYNFSARDTNYVNLPKMQEGHLDAVFMAAYIGQKERDKKHSEDAVEYITQMIKQIHLQGYIHGGFCGVATSRKDLEKLKSEGKKALFIGVENGYGIGKDISNIQKYYDMGARYMTLCHTRDNDICDTSSQTENEWGGLSPFGKKVIKEMNRIGMMIDISHAGVNTFNDVIKLSTKPIIASHSSVRSLCDHDRNLSDDQIRAIAKNDGVIQICPVDIFINADAINASLEDAINHIDYIVNLVGVDYVGIGSDFDGGGRLIGLEGANDLINITIKLIEKGYSDADIEKIWGGNFLRVLEAQ